MDQSEGALVQAGRHVREAEERVARQAAIVEELARNGQEHASEEARKLLASFEKALEMARQHLTMERNAHGMEP